MASDAADTETLPEDGDVRVVVTGGRDFKDSGAVSGALTALGPIAALAHGGASGADTLAHRIAESVGIPVTVFKADWAKEGKAAGPLRNLRMLDTFRPDVVVAFSGGRGTAQCVAAARHRRIRVVVVP